MRPPSMDIPWQARRNALFLLFLILGIAMASWISRTPAIRDGLGASIAGMGFVLFGLSLGSMAGILASGWLVQRAGTRAVALWGMVLAAAGLAVVAAGTGLRSAPVVGLGLGLVGAGMGASDIAVNIDGAQVETLAGRPVLHALHGCYSLGTVVGAVLGMALNAWAVPVAWHLAGLAAAMLPAVAAAIRAIPPGFGRRGAADPRAGARAGIPPWRDGRLLAIGFIVLAMAFAEGSASDWLPLLMVDEHGFAPTSGASVFLAFALAMTVGRFGGGYFLARFGRVRVLRASAVLAVAGIATVSFSSQPALAATAVLAWGLGASLGFPVALSAAGASGPDADARVRVAATAGYLAFLVGPPLLGLVGQHAGLRQAMLVVLACMALAALLAPAAGGHGSWRRRHRREA